MILKDGPSIPEILADGNFGAIDVITKILTEKFTKAPDWLSMTTGADFLYFLYRLPLRGTEIYILYNDKCDRDLEKFLLLLSVTKMGIFR